MGTPFPGVQLRIVRGTESEGEVVVCEGDAEATIVTQGEEDQVIYYY